MAAHFGRTDSHLQRIPVAEQCRTPRATSVSPSKAITISAPASLLHESNVIVETASRMTMPTRLALQIEAGAELTLPNNNRCAKPDAPVPADQLNDRSLQRLRQQSFTEFSNTIKPAAPTNDHQQLQPGAQPGQRIEVPVTDLLERQVSQSRHRNHRLPALPAGDRLAIDVCQGGLYSPLPDLGGQPRGTDHPGSTTSTVPLRSGCLLVRRHGHRRDLRRRLRQSDRTWTGQQLPECPWLQSALSAVLWPP